MPIDVIQKELEDIESKLRSAREVAARPEATERDKSDLKLIEQQFVATRQKARRAPARASDRNKAESRSSGSPPSEVGRDLDRKLDAALKDSFPGSDPVSFVEAAPVKESDRDLPAVQAGEQQAPEKAAAARKSRHDADPSTRR